METNKKTNCNQKIMPDSKNEIVPTQLKSV